LISSLLKSRDVVNRYRVDCNSRRLDRVLASGSSVTRDVVVLHGDAKVMVGRIFVIIVMKYRYDVCILCC
jgi:hypothetical protein